MIDFDSEMTYLQSLRIVARSLIQWPFRDGEWELFIDGVKDALYYGLSPVVRIIALILLPISAPLFAWLAQINRRRMAAAKESAKQRMHDRYMSFNSTQGAQDHD